MSTDHGTPAAIHAGMGFITAEAHAENVAIVRAVIAARPDADEPATVSAFGTLAAQYASMLFGDEHEPAARPARSSGRAHLLTGHTRPRRSVLS